MNEISVASIPGFHEPFSSLSHLLAALVFAAIGHRLVRLGRGDRMRTVSLVVFVFFTVCLLLMSGVYHLLSPGTGRNIVRLLDMASVFALIAGTATPIHAILFTGSMRWIPIAAAWSIAALGITLMTVFAGRLPGGLATATYVLVSWGGIVSCIHLWKKYGYLFIKPLLWGGVAYTAGAALLSFAPMTLIAGVINSHEIWHLFVLLGLALHWRFVFQFADGCPPPTKAARRSPRKNNGRREHEAHESR